MKKYIFITILLLTVSYTLYAAIAQVKLEMGLPNIPGGQIPAGREFPDYINYLFLFGLGLITIVALAQMMIGGLKYILAAGNVGTMEDAKKQIQQALIGMAVLLLSYLLLRTINPDLVSLRNPGLVPLDLKSIEIKPGMSVENFIKATEGTVTPANNNLVETLKSMPDGQSIQTDAGRMIKQKNCIYLESENGSYCYTTVK
ncbi:MAG: hypothetical protein UV48_C0008G0013 [Candidatus Azambacteria bacterium GW2011_GWA2_42_9]|uniref:Uncharacterized protein n=3 Tax=Candidatus Azamiibacteriota TaxID=1752741 RepID=A0A0G0ZC37_9BACT|nr:MAG: hypothetical protein UV07_C0004G0015 [Candidatus Azambacteria bacterium GW2011_GWB1_42_17]KKS46300.1 MAG: hypothetical protein UV10_C0004G0015 [Candidatus Azambacteria bacterium GW2011_GWA1_42_19]KKS75673.1 MAG: hypothetical protein UV48_C0008G0013 [Candidatus Azambacteria bacterium GW2011_GWA2_42_9]KKS88564.1 MAG: hypothetical protein UV62_C0005G0018 [Parcubacteria group bacterium GW2011_GWC1_43_11]